MHRNNGFLRFFLSFFPLHLFQRHVFICLFHVLQPSLSPPQNPSFSSSLKITRKGMRWWGPRVCLVSFSLKHSYHLWGVVVFKIGADHAIFLFLSLFGLASHVNEGYKIFGLPLVSCVKEIGAAGFKISSMINYIWLFSLKG